MKYFSLKPDRVTTHNDREIFHFNSNSDHLNLDPNVIESFGEEWSKFNHFDHEEIKRIGDEYFDILNPILDKSSTYLIDLGCGTGRWSKYLAPRVKSIEAMDPSKAIYSASKLLKSEKNVRLIQSTIDNIPFPDETFDIAASIGVLHHIPDTQKAMRSCVEKVKLGGYFYVYLYYNFEGKGFLFKSIFFIVNTLRKLISILPLAIKQFLCDLIALLVYLPLAKLSGLFWKMNLKRIANMIPLHYYRNKSFFVMRNDSLDRFGTRLEQRFSRNEIIEMMQKSGLSEIVVSENTPLYHALGKRQF